MSLECCHFCVRSTVEGHSNDDIMTPVTWIWCHSSVLWPKDSKVLSHTHTHTLTHTHTHQTNTKINKRKQRKQGRQTDRRNERLCWASWPLYWWDILRQRGLQHVKTIVKFLSAMIAETDKTVQLWGHCSYQWHELRMVKQLAFKFYISMTQGFPRPHPF